MLQQNPDDSFRPNLGFVVAIIVFEVIGIVMTVAMLVGRHFQPLRVH